MVLISGSKRRIIRRIFNILKWTIVALIALLIVVLIVVNLPQVHDYALKKGVAFFNKKTQGQLSVEDITLRLPRHVQLSGVELIHPNGQKMVSLEDIEIEITWPALFYQSIMLDHVNITGLNGTIETDENGVWSYQFIIDGFASDNVEVTDTTASAWDFGIDHMLLKDNHLAYINHQSGDSMLADIGKLAVDMDDFSVLKNHYVVDEINFENSMALIQIGKSVKSYSDTTETALPLIGLSSAEIHNIDFTYQSPDVSKRYHINIGEFALEVDELDLNEMRFVIDEVSLSESQIAIYFPPADTAQISTDTVSAPIDIFSPLFVSCGDVTLNQVDFEMTKSQIESDLQLQNINIELEDVALTPDRYALQINEMAVLYNKETQLDMLEGGLSIDRKQAKFENIIIEAMSSRVDLNGNVMYNELSDLIEKGKYAQLNLEKLDATISPQLINPYLPEEYQLTQDQIVFVETEINGPYAQTSIDLFDLNIGNSSINFQGEIRGDDWAAKSYKMENFTSDIYKSDITNFLIAAEIDTTSIPSEIHLNLDGDYGPNYMAAEGMLKTPFGNLNFDAKDKNGLDNGQEIVLSAKSTKLDIGTLLGMAEPFDLDFDISAEVDLTDSVPSGFGHIHIDTLHYNKTRIHQLDIVTEMDDNNYSVELMVLDSFIVGEFCAYAMIDSTISANLEGTIEGINFYSLGFSSSDLRGTFAIDANYNQSKTFQEIETSITKIMFIRDDQRVDIDPIEAEVYLSDDSTVAFLNSSTLQFSSKSNRSVEEISQAITDLLGGANDAVMDTSAFWKVDFQINDVPEIRELLLPDLKTVEPARGTVNFAANKGTIVADVHIPKIQYKNFNLEKFRFKALGDSANLSSELNIGKISTDTVGIENIQFTTETIDNNTSLKFKIKEDSTHVKYEFNANIKADSVSLANGYNLHLTQPLILNSVEWAVDSLNSIRRNSEGVYIENLTFSNQADSLSIQKTREDNSVIIQASSFDLTLLAGILNLPDPIIQGELFGELTLNNNGSFAGNGYIEDFTLSQGKFGRFEWDANNEDDQFFIDINSDGEDIKLSTKGKIIPQNNKLSQFDFDLNLQEINMGAMPRIFPSIFFAGEGIISGNIKFTGTNEKPVVAGKINVDDVTMGLKSNGGLYKVSRQTIDVTSDEIKLDNFTITDSTSQKLMVNGKITHTYFQDLRADLTIDTEEFTIFNLKPEDNNRIYGKLLAGSNINITGDIYSPSIKARINVSDKTDMTYAVPESNYDEGIDEDMIEWVDFQSKIENNALLESNKGSSTKLSFVEKSVDLTGSLFIDQNAVFKVLVDSAAGDYLEIRGDGKIGVSYDRAGNARMNGTFKVADGFYKMTFYEIVKRQFDFQEGSSITWNGNPTDASLNFTALYKTRVSIANLMSTGNTSSTAETYNEQLPFEVLMIITGDLSKPQISFSIDLAQDRKGAYGGAVEAKLNELKQDENELNKQVFALLVLNTFISSNTSSDLNIASNQARSSASQMLSQQLNNLSDEYVKGVDINFDLQSYGGAAGEGNTDLNIDLAKTFLDNRMIVKVGSTIAIEDNSSNYSDQQTMMANVSVEYKLTPDGRYRFKVFSETDLEDIVVGRITRTGAGIIFKHDFDRINQIFKSDEELKNNDPSIKESEE